MSRATASFSVQRRRRIGLHVGVSIVAVTALVGMVNYLAARHYVRHAWSAKASRPFSPLTRTILASVTNEIQVTVFFDKDEPLFDAVWSLLKEYKFANPRLRVNRVDPERQPAQALALKGRYNLDAPSQRNLVIFDSGERFKTVTESQLSELDLKSFTSGQARDVRRTHFRGELEFTSAILAVTSTRTLRAYFLQGHGEHAVDSEEKQMGYARFGSVLQENNIQYDRLSLLGTNDVPADCHLLIIAGPRRPLLAEELDKLDRYLKHGGRLLALFNVESLYQPTGLEALLAEWGVSVGRGVVVDGEHTITGQDLVVSHYGNHPLVAPLVENPLYLLLPRPVAGRPAGAGGSDGLQVEVLARTSPEGRVITDVRTDVSTGFVLYKRPNDFVGSVPLMVAVEKGGISGVSAERGTTRMVVAGDSIFLGNETLPKLANRDFANHAVNWLLARHELLVGLAPQPITEYTVQLTAGQMTAVRWLFLLVMPGAVLLLGLIVQLRRRH